MSRKKLWGGRFKRPTAQAIERFTHSLSVDQRLARVDLLGSLAHAKMLGKTGIILRADSQKLVRALQSLLKDLDRGRFRPDPSAEDIHTAIQLALERKMGQTAQRLHTARSRNDQVVTSLRLFCKEKLREIQGLIQQLQKQILAQAKKSGKLILPGCTHLRHAQPVLIGHHLLSYLSMLQRDRQRLQEALQRSDELPLGSGALAGTGLPIDRAYVARQLGFSRVMENSIDGVSDRDFVVEILGALGLLAVHLSRIAEDLILWSTAEFGFVWFDETLLTGSSMMPQKQNPDFLELVRGGSARVIGNLTGILTLLKGLPTGYQRDLQNDKEFLFEALDRTEGMLTVLAHGFQGLHWNKKNLDSQLRDESLYATDLAEYLVAKGVSFTQAHRAVGKLLSYAEGQGSRLRSLPLAAFHRFSPAFDQKVYRLLDPLASVQRKRSVGSTHPQRVALSIRRWKTALNR
ncbi:MAG: argininosuccinate lyase [Candidatus Omnitrophica bacterium]|nr:argininosuccinate lyase [Candidatus Omnitrophota bacterium]